MRGVCYMKDYKANIPLYEIIGSDLRAICISDFDDAKADVVRADAEVQQTGASSSSKDTPMTPDLLEEWRKKFFSLLHGARLRAGL